jgi:F1F0 ATPase subunit 2
VTAAILVRFGLGTLPGTFFFGGLWLTVSRLATAKHPRTLSLGSLILRMGVALGGFILLIHGHWQNAAAALAGFTAGRFILSLPARFTHRSTPCI